MPSIQQLKISSFRNISEEALECVPGLNLIAGENGSGKSSILEAIHYAGLGRSFRNTQNTPIIQHNQRDCAVYCALASGVSLGVSRSLDTAPQMRIQGEKATSSADLAKQMPLQLLNAEAFRLLEGGPKARRQYIDWGVFHVEQQFHPNWREFKSCLQNRNALLRKKASAAELFPWNQEFSRLALAIDQYRKAYLERFLPRLESTLQQLIAIENLSFRYYRGWNDETPINEVLENSQERDFALGHTSAGPQRADLKIRIGPMNASAILSRGQQKLLVSALKLAQGAYLAAESDQQCIYLIDDLPAELDRANRQKLCAILHSLGGQVFVSGTDETDLYDMLSGSGFDPGDCKLFHVKHGRISSPERDLEHGS